MNEESYERWTAPFRRNPRAVAALKGTNRLLTGVGYAAYPLLLAFAALAEPLGTLVRLVLVPATGFGLLSAFRRWRNEPRPYEKLAISPLIAKDTRGKSFPSRHTFSMFMIAFSWMAVVPAVGIALTVAGVAMGVIRVLGGVHFPRDVVAGAAFAALWALLGYGLWPLPA